MTSDKYYLTYGGGLLRKINEHKYFIDDLGVFESFIPSSRLGPTPFTPVEEVSESYYRANCKADPIVHGPAHQRDALDEYNLQIARTGDTGIEEWVRLSKQILETKSFNEGAD